MKTVAELLKSKRPGVLTIAPDATVYEALRSMATHDVGALMVVRDGIVVGVLSERDYARKVILQNRSSREIRVGMIMTDRVVAVGPDHTVDDCMALMTDKRIRHLPVVANSRLIGVVSIGDLVKATIAEQAFTIRQLELYIAS